MSAVVVLHPSDELYGADRVLLASVDALAAIGPVQVWLPDDVDYPERALSRRLGGSGVLTRSLPLPVLRRAYLRPAALPGLLGRVRRTARLLRRTRPGTVLLSTSAMLLAAPAARRAGARVVVHVHESWGPLERLALGPFLLAAHDVVVVSDAVARTLPRWAPRPTVVHNGVPSPTVDEDEVAGLRTGAGIADEDLVVVVASRWNAWKGHTTLLQAWDLVERDDLHLVVLGGPPPAGAGVDVREVVATMRHRDRVHVVGEVGSTAPWLAAADALAVPSTAPEPFGLVAVEAGAQERAVLASRTGGLTEIVEDGRTGVLVEPGDVDAWAAALRALDRDVLAEQGRRARRRYVGRFTAESYHDRISRVLVTDGENR